MHVLRKGDTLYFPPNTWHWGYNFGSETSHILESLTPRTEEAIEAYAIKQRWLKDIRYGPRDQIGKFTPGGERGPQRAKLCVPGLSVTRSSVKRSRCGSASLCATEILTTAIVDLYPCSRAR